MTDPATKRDVVRHVVLDLFRTHAPDHLPRWADYLTSAGDFEGRDSTLELFNVPIEDQRPLRQRLRGVIRDAEARLGGSLVLVFHTPEATAKHYSSVIAGRIENALLVSPLRLTARGDLSVLFATQLGPTVAMRLARAA